MAKVYSVCCLLAVSGHVRLRGSGCKSRMVVIYRAGFRNVQGVLLHWASTKLGNLGAYTNPKEFLFVLLLVTGTGFSPIHNITYVGRGGAIVETMNFNRRVVGSTPALAAT